MKILVSLAAALTLVALTGGPGDKPLIVHEWGTFTSVSGSDGEPMVWSPLSGPTELPAFVYGSDRRRGDGYLTKSGSMTTVRMETPVLYFYSGHEMEVNVKVDFPKGAITEWYPKALFMKQRSIEWGRVRVRPGAPDEFPVEDAESHYYPARETDAAPIQVKHPGLLQDEKFLFYRGVGWFALPIKITLMNDRVSVKNLGKDPVEAILFEKRNGRVGIRMLGAVKDEASVAHPDMTSPASEAIAQLDRMLIRSGLYEKEARAMIKTWRDSWFEEGLRVFYLVPRAAADAILPLTLDPKPNDTVRVFVGRAEILTPEMEQQVREIVKRSGDNASELGKELQPFGRFAKPLLRRVIEKMPEQQLKPGVRQLIFD
jgi:hypothetical protein